MNINQHCKNCFCFTDNNLLDKVYKNGTKVQLIGDKFVGEIKHCVIGLRNIRYSILYPGHKYCIVAQHSSLELIV